jgi:hypothetical protein
MEIAKEDIYTQMETTMLANSLMVFPMAWENSEMLPIPQLKLEIGKKVNLCEFVYTISNMLIEKYI